jgi:hypothetical protein
MRGKLVGDEPRLKGHYGGELGWSAVPDIALSNALIGQDMPRKFKASLVESLSRNGCPTVPSDRCNRRRPR